MFNLFKADPLKKLEKEYAKMLEEAMQAQRNGKMDVYAKISSEAEKIGNQIDELNKKQKK
jgi:hypothetical protein